MASRSIKGRYHIKKKNGKVVPLAIFGILVTAAIACFFGVSATVQSWLQDLPEYSNMESFNRVSKSSVYASDGTTLLAEFQLEFREPVTSDAISQYVYNATVSIEDERFYSHNGVDLYGTSRALVNNVLGRSIEGGSTITQQLVRNTVLSDEMTDITLERKVREMYIAMEIEKQYSKEEILLMYLNTINYGSGAYGIEAASERYFSKHASELTLNEAATLAGIPQSPTYNNPIDNPEECVTRRNLVLDSMVKNEYITQEECDAAKAEPITLNVTEISDDGIIAYPYFTSYVRNQLLNSDNYDFSVADVFQGGLTIITTLDIDAQADADAACETKRNSVGDKYEVGLAAIDPDNGYITALVGGYDYESSQVNMATGEGSSGRQVGSSFKTFTLLASIEAGINPQTIIDAGYSFTPEGAATIYNYGRSNYGVRSISSSFAISSNTAFARLAMSVGVDKIIDIAHRCGITSELTSAVGITLGIDSLTPLEMADAYATIANGGVHYDPECIISITDSSGNVIVDNSTPQGEQVVSREVACAAIEVMKGVITSGTATNASLRSGQAVAGKTGTTEEEKDSWFVGITPQLSVAIWLGQRAENYNEAAAIYSEASTVFPDFMNAYLEGKSTESFPTANAPTYDSSYIDEENHVGYGSWYSGSYSYSYGSGSGSSGSSSSAASSSDASSAGTSGGNTGESTGGTGGGGNTGGGDVTTNPDTGGSTGGDSGSGGGTGDSGGNVTTNQSP